MKIVSARDYEDLSRLAADAVSATIAAKPDAVIVLPTGRTPLGLFRQLIKRARTGEIDFGRVRFVTLDEYAGIAPDDRRRLLSWLERELLDPLNVTEDRIVAFDPVAEAEDEVQRIEDAIADLGAIDLAVVGLGLNGHLGFNEPGSDLSSRARMVSLAPESVVSNAAYWGSEDDVPRTAFTLGLGTLLECRSLVVIASGEQKAPIVAEMLLAPIDSRVPASVVRRHPNATVLADQAALRDVREAFI